MPRCLTQKEYLYLRSLQKRNAEDILKKRYPDRQEGTKEYHKGLTKPMTTNERKMRQRIRKKAEGAALTLCLIESAGLAGKGALKDFDSVITMVRDFGTSLFINTIEQNEKA